MPGQYRAYIKEIDVVLLSVSTVAARGEVRIPTETLLHARPLPDAMFTFS